MKKKKLILSFILALTVSQLTTAQLILSNNDLPKVGDIQISFIVDSLQVLTTNPGGTGENILWNFSSLNSQTNDTLSWIDATKSLNYSQFPLANLALNTACTKTHSHVTHTDIETCKNYFYIKNNSGLSYYGSNIQSILKYDIFQNVFPILKYGDSIINESRLTYYSAGTTQKVLHVKGYSKADAWGTITTPAGTVSTIRVYTSEIVYDSTYSNGIGTLTSKTDGNYYYKWYTKGLGYPVLQISKGILNQNSKNQIVEYAAKLLPTSTATDDVLSNPIAVTFYPNPLVDKATLKLNSDVEKYTLSIFDVCGRLIFKTEGNTSNEIVIERNNMREGIYFYNLTINNQAINGKFIVANSY